MKLIITLISCEDLTCPYTNKSIKKNTMAIIKTPNNNNQVFSTTLDKSNGSNPQWNEKFLVEMPVDAHWFHVEVRSGLDTLIGVARIPVSDFVNRLVPFGYLNFLSYRLRSGHGDGFIRGIVNISVRVIIGNYSISRDTTKYCCFRNKENIISMGQHVTRGFDGMMMTGKADRADGDCGGARRIKF